MAKKKKKKPEELAPAAKQPPIDLAAVGRLGTFYEVEIPDFGQVRIYALQPEQITILRQRLATAGLNKLADIDQLNPDQLDPQLRQQLAHIWRLGARWPHDQPATSGRPASLRFPGQGGLARVEQLDTPRIVALARQALEFNQLWYEEPA